LNTPFIYEIKKRLKPLIEEYSVATRYFFLVVCGFSVSLIFSVIVDYSYPDKIAYLTDSAIVSPFSSSNGVYEAFGTLITYSLMDTSFLLAVFIGGLTCLYRSVLSVLNIVRGFFLGLMICAFSSQMDVLPNMAFSSFSIALVITEFVIASVLIVFYSSFAEIASRHFVNASQVGMPIIFSKRFFSYFLLFMFCFGATLLLRILLSALLYALTIV
jgi:hypothetical protein